MDFEKSPSAHVCDPRLQLKCRETFPFVLADRYDPKQDLKYKKYFSKMFLKKGQNFAITHNIMSLKIYLAIFKNKF